MKQLTFNELNSLIYLFLWLQVLGKESEKFGGDTLLNGQEQLMLIRKQMDGWTDNALKVFTRHRKDGQKSHPDQENMMQLNEVCNGSSQIIYKS